MIRSHLLFVWLSLSYFLLQSDSIGIPTIPTCGENEVVNPCPGGCSKTCDDVINNRTPGCPTICIGTTSSCSCKPGYARNITGPCITERECLNDLNVCQKFNETKICPHTFGVSCTMHPCLLKPCTNTTQSIKY
ncbi:hypothetical protein B4U80_13898 [Leptotrombidium deliense]|uniref:TIL domain-containing protein n=1 Tax=Leptotrombidium deliense TaxID=299467 RepID=A0A443S8H6_9ACAR|nr:hypothetical protein B4U80_13898 [Leptotrombidium deliense]